MLLIRPLPPIPCAGRRQRFARRFLLIQTRQSAFAKDLAKRPKFGARRYLFDGPGDGPPVTEPTMMLCKPARLNWNDREFRDIRRAVARHQAAVHAQANVPEDEADDVAAAQLASGLAWSECEHLAHVVFNYEPLTIRDVFLRAEMLTMHYGDDGLSDLLASDCPAERLLGGLLDACWKVGGAANV